jgi:hypothetical protein
MAPEEAALKAPPAPAPALGAGGFITAGGNGATSLAARGA